MSDFSGIMASIRAMFTDVEYEREQLHDYQRDKAIPFLKENPFSMLLIGMGMGKTISALTVVADLTMEFLYDKVLIVGPMRVATQTWPNEIRAWRHTAHMRHSLIHISDDNPSVKAAGKAARVEARLNGMNAADANKVAGKAETAEKERLRIIACHSDATVHIIPIDWVEWLVDHYKWNWPYRMVIIDESSTVKDHTTNRFKALRNLVNHVPKKGGKLIERFHLMTATPAAETYEHLFAQTFLLDGGKRFGKHITHFRNEFFVQNQYTKKYTLRPNAEEALLAKIADIALVMKAEDYLDLKEPEIHKRPIRLAATEMELYKRLERDFIVTLPNGREVEAETAAALSQKLLQMASGVLYETYLDEDLETGDMKKVKMVHQIHDQKLDELAEIVEEAQGEPVLVAYWWKASLDRLRKRFPKAVVMDADGKCVKDWNAGKIKMLLMHPMSGGHGLNLQKGGHIMAIFDMFHSLELFIQLVGRLARQGQKNVVQVYLLTALGTLDEVCVNSQRAKEEAQEKMFRILKRLIAEYRKQKEANQQMELAEEL